MTYLIGFKAAPPTPPQTLTFYPFFFPHLVSFVRTATGQIVGQIVASGKPLLL